MLNLVLLLKRSVNSDRGNEKDTKKEVRAPEYSVEEGSIKVGGCYRQTYWYKMSCAESQTIRFTCLLGTSVQRAHECEFI